MMANISIHDWLELPQEVRSKLIEIFQIPRSGVGHINYTGKGAEITSDGYTYEDLKAIGVASMQQYLNSTEEDFFVLFNEVVRANEAMLKDPTSKPLLSQKGDPQTEEPESEPQTKERWTKVIKDLKVEAGQKGLLPEFNKILKVLVKNV